MQDTVILDIYIPLSFTQLVFGSCGLLGIIPPKERAGLHLFNENFFLYFFPGCKLSHEGRGALPQKRISGARNCCPGAGVPDLPKERRKMGAWKSWRWSRIPKFHTEEKRVVLLMPLSRKI